MQILPPSAQQTFFAVQALPTTAMCRDVDINIQHTSVVDAHLRVSLARHRTVNKSECTGKCSHPPGDSKAALDF